MGFKFESLNVWKRSIDFADAIFVLAEAIPQQYQFSLGEQLRRAALSIPTNIAEGSGRDKLKEKQYFFRIAKGSVYEVVSLMVMMGKRGFIDADGYKKHRREANEIAAILTTLSNAPSSSSSPL